AVNRIRLDDMHPHIYKTNDGGITWKEIVNGLPDDPVNVVREDPVRKGLLYAGTERAVFVSFDDGGHWQSLRLNMPATSIRDLVVKDNDLVIGTHGRSFWILDAIAPLRQRNAQAGSREVILYQPVTTYRVRWSMNTDTPLPQEEPAGENPPDGAPIDYYLADGKSRVSLEITDAKGNLVFTAANTDQRYEVPAGNVPSYWIRPQQELSSAKGAHRFVWDLHYTPIKVPASFPMSAVYMNTAPNPTSPLVMPGRYTVKLIADGKTFVQNFTIKMDPRVKTTLKDVQLQHDLSLEAYRARTELMQMLNTTVAVQGNGQQGHDNSGATRNVSLAQRAAQLASNFASIHDLLQDSDMPATSQMIKAMNEARVKFAALKKEWAKDL
ncbi:MAG TPA: hypothetical protein VNR87_10435, partial [Flavisolibacter sp.]|nr:hypothetical protein [Flavisolibacter sp.]